MKPPAFPLALLLLAACGPSDPPPAALAAVPECCASDLSAARRDAAGAAVRPVIAPDFLKPAGSRTFSIEYAGKVPGIPPGAKKLRVWIPVPQDSSVQTLRNLRFSKPPKIATEPKYGNRIAFWEIENPGPAVEITMTFDCSRLEIRTDLDALQSEGKDEAGAFEVFRRADALVLVDDEMKRLSDRVCEGRTGTLGKARAVYDHVLSRMTYDKDHEGWGRGSTRHACDVGKGNCTDFHALFNSLCRAQGIASSFEIGLYLPYERRPESAPGGYHCWASFRVPGRTWVPVDCSEASRMADRKDYFFGGHTPNRVTLSTGRDLVLVPAQAGAPLNYFLNPYAEADGKPVRTDKAWSFKDLD